MITKGSNYDEIIRNTKRVRLLQETIPGYKKLMRKLIRKKKSLPPSIKSPFEVFPKGIENSAENDQETDFSSQMSHHGGSSHYPETTNSCSEEDWLSCSLNDAEENQFILRSSENLIFEESLHSHTTDKSESSRNQCEEDFLLNNPKIIEFKYDTENKDFVFMVEHIDETHNLVISRISRMHLMKLDPLSVLYFYEKNLEITKNLGLKQI